MKIESKIKRKAGTKVDIDGVDYHFKPQADGAHVCEVSDKKHIQRFLSITEGYQIYDPDGDVKKPAKESKENPGNEVVLLGAESYDEVYEINGKTYEIGALVVKAYEKSGKTADEWNDPSGKEARDAAIDAELDALANEVPLDREALVAEYTELFGKKPHHKSSAEKIKAEIEAAIDAAG